MPKHLTFAQRMDRGLPVEKQSELEQIFDGLRNEEYRDPEAEFDICISSAGDSGRGACGAFAGALLLMDHATVFLSALKQHHGAAKKTGEVLTASASILKALAEQVELPEDNKTLQVVSRLLSEIGITIASDVASPDWEEKQRRKLELLADQASFSLTGTGNELFVLPWAFEVEKMQAVPPLDERVTSLRKAMPDKVRDFYPIEASELNLWAYFLLLIGRWKAATPMAVIATEMEATSANLDTLGWAHFFEGDNDKSVALLTSAIRILERAVGTPKWGRRVSSDWAESGYHKCYVLTHSGRTEEASELLQRLKALAPDSFWTHKADNLGSLLLSVDQSRSSERRSRTNEAYSYDVALSFAGEDRQHAVQIAERLKSRGITVFYDEFEKAELWGKNLYSHLSDLYMNKARFCIMLLSKNYSAKRWPTLEREAAQARAFGSDREYILPVRIDASPISGVLPTLGYLDWQKEGPDGVVENLCKKLLK